MPQADKFRHIGHGTGREEEPEVNLAADSWQLRV